MITVAVHDFAPHRGRTYPNAALAVERLIDHHGFHGFRMMGKIQKPLFITLEVPVPAGKKRRQSVHKIPPFMV